MKCDNQKGVIIAIIRLASSLTSFYKCSNRSESMHSTAHSAYPAKWMRYVFIDWSLFDSGLDQPLMNICMYGMAVCLSVACMRFVSALQSVICYIWLLLFCDIWFWQWMDFNAKRKKKEKKVRHGKKTMCRLPKNGRRKKEKNVYAISPGRYIFALCIRRYNRYTDGV